MDLRDIEYFAVIAEHGQIARAQKPWGWASPH
jgi:DNA-binding transcriptional LysR family regulator